MEIEEVRCEQSPALLQAIIAKWYVVASNAPVSLKGLSVIFSWREIDPPSKEAPVAE